MFRAFERIADLTEDIYRQGSELTAAADDAGRFADLDVVAPMTTVLIGEAVHNLRASLDHLVYQLSALDSGNYQPGVRFPLCGTTAEFYSGDGLFALTGLIEAHGERIEALQPYNGVAWARQLLALSSPYGQRTLVLTVPEAGSTAPMAESGETRILAFADGTPVVTTLGELAREVAQVLESFNPEFA